MPRTLFLHSGPGKTGTSAIQAVLRDATPPGLLYPTTGQWPDGAHHKILFAMRGKTKRGDIDIPPFEDLMSDLCAELDAAETDVVISSESFGTQDFEVFLDHLNRRLERPFDDMQVIVVLRHPLERAASAYNQNIKDMALTTVQMPKPYLETSALSLRLAPLVRAWKTMPVPVTFLNYHPSATLVHRFFETIGHLPEDGKLPEKTHNQSISGYALLTLLAGRMVGLSPEDLKTLFKGLRQDKTRQIWQGPSFPFARNSCLAYLETVVTPDLAEVERLTGLAIPNETKDVPKRFQLGDDDLASIRDRVTAFTLSTAQAKRLDSVLAAFAMQKPKPATQN